MSDPVVSFIPKVCDFLPEQTVIEAIEAVVSDLFEGCTEISINKAYELPFFINSGQTMKLYIVQNVTPSLK